ncbi:hypothetical protein D9M68_685740 [compost metagenome]
MTFSVSPPTSLTITGLPAAIISRHANEIVSSFDDSTKPTSSADRNGRTSPSRPVNTTWSDMPSSATRCICSASGSLPAIRITTCRRCCAGNCATAATMSSQFLYTAVPALLPMTSLPCMPSGSRLSRARAAWPRVAGRHFSVSTPLCTTRRSSLRNTDCFMQRNVWLHTQMTRFVPHLARTRAPRLVALRSVCCV